MQRAQIISAFGWKKLQGASQIVLGNPDQTVAKGSSSLAGVHAVQNFAKVQTGIRANMETHDAFTRLFAHSATSLMDLALSSWIVD